MSNSNVPMIFVTFHQTPNVYAYSADDGTPINPPTVLPPSTALDEPRGIYLDSAGNLVLVDGASKVSTVYYCVRSSPGSYGAPVPFLAPGTANSIKHPYALAFDPASFGPGAPFQCFVSNQDSNVVAGFTVTIPSPFDPDKDTIAVAVNPVAAYLGRHFPQGNFLDGTLVASAVNDLPDVLPDNPEAVPSSKGGLGVIMGPDPGKDPKKPKYKVQHSVRDLAYIVVGSQPATPVLLVIDEAAGVVRMVDLATGKETGHPLGQSAVAQAPGAILNGPSHLLVVGTTVYVSFADQIYSGAITQATGGGLSLSFAPAFNLPGATLSGMAVDPSGHFYVADRKGKVLSKYDSTWSTKLWEATLSVPNDDPEFLLYVAG